MEIPNVESSALILIDFQEKLVPVMDHFETILPRAQLLLDGAAALRLDVMPPNSIPADWEPPFRRSQSICR